jgi:ArsR family transcriptional regulator
VEYEAEILSLMPDYTALSELAKALAHPARLHILDLLRGGELCVCHIEAALGKRQAYVSQQLMFLREAGLVQAEKRAGFVYYRLSEARLLPLLDALLAPAEGGLERLAGCACPQCALQPNVLLVE